MAEVLPIIVQPTPSLAMLHQRPSSADNFQPAPPSQRHHQSSNSLQMPRNHMYNAQGGSVGYRGTSGGPIAPYAFQTTPHLRQDNRTNSAPVNPYNQPGAQSLNPARRHLPSSSTSTSSTSSSSVPSNHHTGTKDDSAIPNQRYLDVNLRPASQIDLSVPTPDFSSTTAESPSKAPERYRRINRKPEPSAPRPTGSASPSGSGMASVGHLYQGGPPSPSARTSIAPSNDYRFPSANSSADDMQLPKQGTVEQAKRYRRRSVGSFDTNAASAGQAPVLQRPPVGRHDSNESRPSSSPVRPASHQRTNSSDSLTSSRPSSRQSGAKRDVTPYGPPQLMSGGGQQTLTSRNVQIPPRGSSDATKRMNNPSPLSQPAVMSDSPRQETPRSPPGPGPMSPAVQQLSALSDKDLNKGMKSRLRRAFSFGSAAEFRKVAAQNSASPVDSNKEQQRPKTREEIEQEAIARKQEASGLGTSIYTQGQGNVFTGSTDNVSISSTASSASMMLRKMGKGMKKSTRSLKGLFRAKSVIGVPAADGPVTQPSMAQVSMITVEAERDRVNVNVDPRDHAGGGTGFPHLEKNSVDTRLSIETGSDRQSRRSIVGGERERAEVLAAVRKGILKRSGTGSGNSSPVVRPADNRTPNDFGLPAIPHVNDTPASTAPSTPADDAPSSAPVVANSEDYFANKLGNLSTRSIPRSISFSPRIQFHDAWSASDYDRRGEIATCNRLTPMLAQQIKEELNTFKMEMEVHEQSKPHTHFF